MDKKLLAGAFTLLLFEILFLLGDLNLLPFKIFNFNPSTNSYEIIGQVSDTKQNVRKKSQDSVMWETTNSSDPIHAYDSILTLSKSAAKIKLKGDINIQLHENTLIVMEPTEKDEDNEFRLKFTRGHLRSKSDDNFKFGAGSWTIQAHKGSDLSLRKNNDGQLEMEVVRGTVELENKVNNKKIKANKQRITLSNQDITSLNQISQDLLWEYSKDIRLYTHKDSEWFQLKWQGQAQKIEFIHPNGTSQSLKTLETDNSHLVHLNKGTSYFTLFNSDGVSKKLAVHVWPAESVQYFSPLPRTRVETNTQETFSWSSIKQAKNYFIEFSDTPNFSHSTNLIPAEKNIQASILQEEGSFYWRIIGIDEEGFPIPAQYYYPIHSVKNPLAAPQLEAPKFRNPASDKQKKKPTSKKESKTSFIKLLDLLFPKAYAQETANKKNNLVFKWQQVPQADFYIIEISHHPDFENPSLIKKVNTNEFIWSDFSSDIYYWRVAAGQSNGRKGLFSEPAQINLKNIENEAAGEITPGVELVKAAPTPKSAPAPVAPTPVAIESKAITTQITSPPLVTPADEMIPEPIYLSDKDTHWTTELWTLMPYYYFTQTTGSELDASLTGFTTPFVGLRFNAPMRYNGSFVFQVEWGQTKWEPKSKSTLPFQQEKTITWSPSLFHYRPQGYEFSFGVSLKQLPYLEKSGLEEVDIQNRRSVNASMEFASQWQSQLRSRHIVQLGVFDQDLMNFSILNSVQHKIPMLGQSNTYWGGQLDVDFISGDLLDDGNAINSRIGVTLGYEW